VGRQDALVARRGLVWAAQVFPFDATCQWPKEIVGRAMDTYHQTHRYVGARVETRQGMVFMCRSSVLIRLEQLGDRGAGVFRHNAESIDR
jgi:hypothetical protein